MENTKYYSAPFRKENYEKHNSNQHPVEWEKYKKVNKEEKMSFWNNEICFDRTFHLHKWRYPWIHCGFKDCENIIAHLFFCPDGDLDALYLEKSMAPFKNVKNMKRLELVLDHTSIGLSFRQTSVVID